MVGKAQEFYACLLGNFLGKYYCVFWIDFFFLNFRKTFIFCKIVVSQRHTFQKSNQMDVKIPNHKSSLSKSFPNLFQKTNLKALKQTWAK
jgi:hypothetical protein